MSLFRDSIRITKKENQDSIGITKNREKRLWDSIRIPKKAPKSCLGIPIFFFGILRDSSGFCYFFGHICSSGTTYEISIVCVKKSYFFNKKLADISQIKSPVRNCLFQTGSPPPQKKHTHTHVEDFRSHDLHNAA